MADNPQLLATIAVACLAAIGFAASRLRQGRTHLTLLDGVLIVLVMMIATAAAVPLLDSATTSAKESAMRQNLFTLRSQIALYKAQHGGEPPLLYKGQLPQLSKATNAGGEPGPPGSRHPYGPYLPMGIPVNPITGRALVTEVDAFPPKAASGNGGWLYHQETGQIAPDVPEMLDR